VIPGSSSLIDQILSLMGLEISLFYRLGNCLGKAKGSLAICSVIIRLEAKIPCIFPA